MDITTVTSFRRAYERADLQLAPGEVVLAGGTWLMSEPQPTTTGFVDLMTLGWPSLEITPTGLRIAATCTIAELVAWAEGRGDVAVPAEWTAASVFPEAANALLASFKIWNTATVGGNICRSYAAGAITTLAVALDGEAEIWMPGGGERRMPVAELITGNGTNSLAPGEVLRAVELPAAALRSTTVLRKIALAELGRSGAVVTGRIDDDGSSVFTVTAAVLRPVVLGYAGIPDAATLAAAVADAPGYYTDPLGAADWRRGVSVVLAERIRGELAGVQVDAEGRS
ncbi:CO/xanthine dehydrogenase FAD-binding subunit [Microbacterium terrae]|uniref:Xanthine dehydrogenase subunit XdhB n=1 Tax=Microbacterium terrae TaxID=69369 RepID=A0A0M2HCI3_9MICO|nr:FAD binding domain-containing protein [Microbacterium terrae]KJL44230.1 xanthine dehydrogenase subunit XdhB [Microbacterium terrae]MBP1078770.1 CO/xanthine dehydrogenase FAD-binding subunit [Microbacterium terrae]GLJ98171.1 FAD-binding molybdopterin dehydrogenase [Microbacterium terrae]